MIDPLPEGTRAGAAMAACALLGLAVILLLAMAEASSLIFGDR